MGLDELLGYTTETGARLIEDFLKTGHSQELDLAIDSSKDEWPIKAFITATGYYGLSRGSEYAIDNVVSLSVMNSIQNAAKHIIKNYKYDGDNKYLKQIVIMASSFAPSSATTFYKKLKKSNFYAKLDKDLKALIERSLRERVKPQ